jgi:hypothetical protein
MSALRPSDHAVAASSALVLWLLARTALRADVVPAVAASAIGYLASCVLRRAAGPGRADPTVPLYAWLLAHLLLRALEDRWGAGGRETLSALACTAICVSAGGALPARPALSAALFSLAITAAVLSGSTAWVASTALLILLARASAVVSRRSATSWWALSLIAAGWASRGATIGPLAWMIGAGRAASQVRGADDERQADREERADLAAIASVAIWVATSRAWERCALLFL